MCVISTKHRCVFIHIPKNAGGSVRQGIIALGGSKPGGIHQHAPATTLRKLNPTQYDSFFSFAIVRNPWDRLWSMYKFALGRKGQGHPDVGNSFDEFLNTAWKIHPWTKTFKDPNIPAQRRSQTEWILDENGRVIVDFVVRFENLQEDLEKVYEMSNVPPLKLASHHSTSQKIHYTDAFSDSGIEFVRKHFAKDIEMFGYKFGD